MKKILSVILSVMLIFFLSSCAKTNLKDNNSSSTIVVYEEQAYRAEAGEQNTTTETLPELTKEPELPDLTAEDIAVKEKIAKYSKTKVDFRNLKQEKIGKKTYEISFSQVISNKDIMYTNVFEDIFWYNDISGKLYYANIQSVVTAKDADSIDIESAQKIAYEYACSKCNIDEYILDRATETDKGYEFTYRRYINDCKTADVLAADISFSGDIFCTVDNTDVFKNIDIQKINVNKDWINERIEERLSIPINEGRRVIENSVVITVEDKKPEVRFETKSYKRDGLFYDNGICISHIPIEYNVEE